MRLTPQQMSFFETFGYIVLPGLIKDDIDWITDAFEQVFRERQVNHDYVRRSCVFPIIDQHERLCTLLDHPKIDGLITSILGEDYNYVGGDGNFYAGDTSWHSDGFHHVGRFLKVAFYLDPVKRDTGCLRVIPGTHRLDLFDAWDARRAGKAQELWGIEQKDVPAIPLESNPGDVVAFTHNLVHASFGGSSRRRMFTMNCSKHAETPEEVADLENYINAHARFWVDSLHSDIMRQTAPPGRMRHLSQVTAHETKLPELAAMARQQLAEASRG